jgi:hypothetical protein
MRDFPALSATCQPNRDEATSKLLKKDPECFENLSMNGKSSKITTPVRSSLAPPKDSERVFSVTC